jgi:RNA polymerase sigma-70 factor (ECF subfamily)
VLRFRSRSQPAPQPAPDPAPGDAALDEAALVAAARADRQAFRPLYERHVAQIYRYCYLQLGSREAAEDATSDVFLKALAGLDGYRGGPFAGWLFRIAQHTVIDVIRQRRRVQPALPLEAASELMDPDERPDQIAIQAADQQALLAALQALPSDQRTLVELQLVGLTTPEIAAALGRSQGAVRMLRLRAFQQLRPILEAAERAGNPARQPRQGGQPC